MKFCVALAVLAMPAPAHAADAETIVVTGRSLAAPIGIEAYDSVVIARDRLALNASGRLEDVLSDVAGFQQFRRADSRAANPTSQGATLRALGGNAASRALVLLDAVPQADPFTGFIPYSALRPERLASARITRGGGAGAFGAGAVAGTIELASGGPDDLPGMSARAFTGSRSATELSAGIVQPLGAGFVTANAGWDRGDGYFLIPAGQRGAADIPASYDAWSFALRGVAPIDTRRELQVSGLVFDDHRLRGLVGTASRSRGADASIKLVGRGPCGFEALAYVQERGFRSGFVATAPDRASTATTLNQFNTPSLGLGAKLEVRPCVGGDNSIRFGADIRSASGRTNETFRYVMGAPTRLRRAGGVNTIFGGFIEGSTVRGALTLTGGARLDRWAIRSGVLTETAIGTGLATQDLRLPDRSGIRPSFRGGALLTLSENFDVRAAGYTGFRVPTLNELYRPFRVGADATAANGALELERLKGFEGGLGVHGGDAALRLTAFWNQLDGAIANVTLGAGPGAFPQVGFVAAGGVFRQRLNVDAIEVRGIEATAMLPVGAIRLSASYAFTDARVSASGVASPLNAKRPAQTPEHQGTATVAYMPRSGPQASLSVRYTGTQFEDDLQRRVLPDTVTIDGVVSVPMTDRIRIVVRAENLFDEKIVSGLTSTGIEDLGTPQTFWVGITFGR